MAMSATINNIEPVPPEARAVRLGRCASGPDDVFWQ
jgi:hypothetical protein